MKTLTHYLNSLTGKLNTIAAETSNGFIAFLAIIVTIMFVAAMVWGRA
ncbi:hypothetical protein [Alishewanella sp. HL-SH06]